MIRNITTILFIAAIACGCSFANKDDVKVHAEQRFKELGFKIVGYEGYQMGLHIAPGYGGAHVWYTLRRVPDNGFTYTGSLQKWGNEYHNSYLRSYESGAGNPQ